MKYIKEYNENTIIINKSKFIGQIFPVENLNEVEEILKNIRKKYYDATHNCYAYIIGDKQEYQKASDDGEPAKTAGAPILDVLKKQEMTNCLVIVTRYFGGILLGAGGLVRAYSEACSEVLKLCDKYIVKEMLEITIPLSYKTYNNLNSLDYIKVLETHFNIDVLCKLVIDIFDKDKFIKDINNLTKEYENNYEFNKITTYVKEK